VFTTLRSRATFSGFAFAYRTMLLGLLGCIVRLARGGHITCA